MRSAILIVTSLLLATCTSEEVYTYVEYEERQDISHGGTEIIQEDKEEIIASSDSIAYAKALTSFYIGRKLSADIRESMNYQAGIPVRFDLSNQAGVKIESLLPSSVMSSMDSSIRRSIMSEPNTMSSRTTSTVASKFDSAAVAKLEGYFRSEADEFDPAGPVVYTPRSAPKFVNSNGIFFYFSASDKSVSDLVLRIQYHADKWLFWHTIQFLVDGEAFTYRPPNVETDSGNGGKIWEWSSEALGSSDYALLDALSTAKSAKMKFIGQQYSKVKVITKQQLQDIQRAKEYYLARGGEF